MRPLADLAAAHASGQWPLVELDAARLLRLTRYPTTEPYWGRERRYRFDDPVGVYGVTYGAERLDVTFTETVLHEQGAFIDGRWVIDQARIEERFIVRFMHPAGRPLQLTNLTGVELLPSAASPGWSGAAGETRLPRRPAGERAARPQDVSVSIMPDAKRGRGR